MSVNGLYIDSLIDTGANCSIIKESIAKSLNYPLFPYYLQLHGIGDGNLNVFARIKVPVQFNDVCIELDLLVAKDTDLRYNLLIGRNVIEYPDIELVTDSNGCILRRKYYLGQATVNTVDIVSSPLSDLINNINSLDQRLQDEIVAIFQNYPCVLNKVGTIATGELRLRLKKDDVVNYRPYRLAPIERDKINHIITDLLEKNIIRESVSPFASPVLLVKKKDGSDRLCVDYRALNKLIEKDRYPLPLIEDQIDRLGKARYYISIDMKNGFYQVPVATDSIKYTAFVTPDGHYEFLKMPFGICNGPSVFQRAITKAVQHLKFLLVYIDDILIPFTTIDQGLLYLKQTISALSSTGFTINIKKCKFFVNEVEYLGRHISCEGVRPSETKVSALVHSPVPTTVKQIRQFMGLASYFRKFIPEFATQTACITKLIKNNQQWEWGSDQEAARNYVIKHLVSKPLLTIFNPTLPTELHTDASAIGYGAILIQKVDNSSKVVAYFSKRTSPAESRYCSYDLETLAIYNALKNFRVYLLGIHFVIVTDCNAIKSTMNKKDLSPRVARWWTYMQDFQFEVLYRKGKYISHVDFLSRNPVNFPKLTYSVNLINSSPSWLETAQQNDPDSQSLIEKLRNGDLNETQYCLRNNLLCYKFQLDASPKFFVPKGCRISILRLFHDENCHVGYDKTLCKIRENFWFPGMTSFVKKYLRHCLICVTRKSHSGPNQGFLHPIEKAAVPFQTIHLDCTGPFAQSSEGFRYVLLLVDGFTKFCLLKPLKNLKADELIPIIRETITIFGTPSLAITDRGTNFNSHKVQSLFRELQIDHHMIATGTPRANGQVERYVATVINMLNSTCNGESDWPSGLWKVQQSINTTIQKSTGFSPLRLLIGVDANIPCVQARLNEIREDDSSDHHINVRADRDLACQRLQQVAMKSKDRFDSVRRNNKNYQIGDTVFVNQDHRRHDKLQTKFKGPYIVTACLENDRYALKESGNLRNNIIVAKEKIRYWPGELLN